MKPKLFILVAALSTIGFSAVAQKAKYAEPVTRSIHLKESFSSLVINNDISVVLTESSSEEIVIKGDESRIKKCKVQVDDGKLFLSYLQTNEKPDVQVYVPARFLNKVIINGKSELTSSSILSNAAIRVIIAGESKVHLRSIGKVTVEGTDDFDFIRIVR